MKITKNTSKKTEYKNTVSKKILNLEPNKSLLNVWNSQRWYSYNELEPCGKLKARGIFKEILFDMGDKFIYNFSLTEIEYLNWRKVKPSFIQGK